MKKIIFLTLLFTLSFLPKEAYVSGMIVTSEDIIHNSNYIILVERISSPAKTQIKGSGEYEFINTKVLEVLKAPKPSLIKVKQSLNIITENLFIKDAISKGASISRLVYSSSVDPKVSEKFVVYLTEQKNGMEQEAKYWLSSYANAFDDESKLEVIRKSLIDKK